MELYYFYWSYPCPKLNQKVVDLVDVKKSIQLLPYTKYKMDIHSGTIDGLNVKFIPQSRSLLMYLLQSNQALSLFLHFLIKLNYYQFGTLHANLFFLTAMDLLYVFF